MPDKTEDQLKDEDYARRMQSEFDMEVSDPTLTPDGVRKANESATMRRKVIAKKKLKSRQERIDKLKAAPDVAEDQSDRYLRKGETRVGSPQGRDSIVLAPNQIKSHLSAAEVGFDFNEAQTVLNTGNTAKLDTPVNQVEFKGLAINARAKHTPPNMVNNYPLLMKQPPKIYKGVIRGIVTAMVTVVRELKETETESGEEIQLRRNILLETPEE